MTILSTPINFFSQLLENNYPVFTNSNQSLGNNSLFLLSERLNSDNAADSESRHIPKRLKFGAHKPIHDDAKKQLK